MAKKSESDLARDEKIDLARTLTRFKYRRYAARELNEIEDKIITTHDAEVSKGTWTQLDLDSIGVNSLTRGLPSGTSDSKSPKRTTSSKKQ